MTARSAVSGRRGGPVVVLVATIVTITMVLLVAWRWAEHQTRVGAAPTGDAAIEVDPAAVQLSTPLLSVRRAPAVLARHADVAAFRAALQPLLDGINDTSCASFAVDGRPVASVRPDVPVVPASNMKLVTAAVALDVLGESAVFTTRVLGDIGDTEEVGAAGVVVGDLFLVGGGDPLLSTSWWPTSGLQTHPPFGTTSLEQLADDVVAAGVQRITGSVVGDGSRYDDEWYPPSWEEPIRKVEAGPIDALVVNDSHTDPARPADVVDDPAAGAAALFSSLLQARGVLVDGLPRSGPATTTTQLAAATSYPLGAIVAEMLQTSDDDTAEMLLKEVGLQQRALGTREAGVEVVRERLTAWGVPMEGLVLVDGSGLSNDDRLTCSALVAILARGSVDDQLGIGLPVAGESGTLTDLFVGTPLAGRLHAKTGSLDNLDNTTPTSDPPAVRALSGYVEVDGGGVIQFSLVLNGQTVADPAEYGHVWNDLLAPALASYPAGVRVDDLAPR